MIEKWGQFPEKKFDGGRKDDSGINQAESQWEKKEERKQDTGHELRSSGASSTGIQ
jgi:hypothetical protein